MKFLIVAPFWGNPQHVGVYRVDRFLRWLSNRNIPVVLVRRGNHDGVENSPWGITVSIHYPLRPAHAGTASGQATTTPDQALPIRFAKWAARHFLIPDTEVAWAWRAATHPLVRKYGVGATHVLSSSPPESPHVGASRLARSLGARHVVDMRDGWLDEPLRPILLRSRLRRWLEGIQEKRILKRAANIFVTSQVWKELLEARLPFTQGKITVLTNAYPAGDMSYRPIGDGETKAYPQPLTLLHSGRFTGSSLSRRPRHLLGPLLQGINERTGPGELLLLGDLSTIDIADIDELAPEFQAKGWSLRIQSHVSRAESLRILQTVDGLLLLSTSYAAVPSKLFEYIPSGKPILALTPEQSAVWRIGEKLQQLFLLDYSQKNENWISTSADFIESARTKRYSDVPLEFSEEHLSTVFYKTLLDE